MNLTADHRNESDLRASEFDLIMKENEIELALFVVTFMVVDLTMKRCVFFFCLKKKTSFKLSFN